MEEAVIENKEKFEAIVCVINQGFTDLVMTAAKSAGARGGTVFKAWGTGNPENQEFFGVLITPEKEVCIILVPESIRDKVLLAINKGAGLATKGQGIAFCLPCSDVIGITHNEEPKQE